MTFDEFTNTLRYLGFKLPSNLQGTWYIDSTQLKYINGAKSSCDVFGFFWSADGGCFHILLPKLNLDVTDISFLSLRKHDLWTDCYTNTYSYWDTIPLKDLTVDRLKSLLNEQENKYKILNSLHKETELGEILKTIKNLRSEMNKTKKQITSLNYKIMNWYNKRISIEND